MKTIILTTIVLALSLTIDAAPKNKEKKNDTTTASKIYLFGVSQQLTDTVVYMTDIQEIESITVDKKTRFLPYRSEFSLQVKEYLEGTKKLHKQTACIFFSKKMKDVTKMRTKLKKKYFNTEGIKLVLLDNSEFQFKNPMEQFEIYTNNTTQNQSTDGNSKAEK